MSVKRFCHIPSPGTNDGPYNASVQFHPFVRTDFTAGGSPLHQPFFRILIFFVEELCVPFYGTGAFFKAQRGLSPGSASVTIMELPASGETVYFITVMFWGIS